MLTVLLPLAQMNTASTAPSATAAGAPAPAAPAVAPATAPGAGAPEAVATTGVAGTSTAPAASRPQDVGILGQFGPLLIMGLMLAGLYFFMTRGQRKEEKRRKGMMS